MKNIERLAWLAVSGIVLVGGVGAIGTLRAAAPPPDRQVSELLQEQATAAATARGLAERRFEQGFGGYEDVLTWSRREVDAKLELAASKEERVALLKEPVNHSKRAEAIAAARQKLGAGGDPLEVQAAHFERLAAEIRLARAQEP